MAAASVRDAILDAAVAALLARLPPGLIAANSVFRSRQTPITRNISPAIVVRPAGEDTARMGQSADRHVLRMRVSHSVRGDPWDVLVEPIAAESHRILMTDPGIRALAVDLRMTGTDWEAEEADQTAGTLTHLYDVTYLSRPADLSSAPGA